VRVRARSKHRYQRVGLVEIDAGIGFGDMYGDFSREPHKTTSRARELHISAVYLLLLGTIIPQTAATPVYFRDEMGTYYEDERIVFLDNGQNGVSSSTVVVVESWK
jgi:hypothetical protein